MLVVVRLDWKCHDIYGSFNTLFLKNEEREYSILLVMSELSTVRYDRALGLGLQVHGRQVSTGRCRGGVVADGPRGGRR